MIVLTRPPFQRQRGGAWFAQAKLVEPVTAESVTITNAEWPRPFATLDEADDFVRRWAEARGLTLKHST